MREIKVDFTLKGKTLKGKRLQREGNYFTLEGMAGAMHRVLNECGGIIKIGKEIYYAKIYNEGDSVECKISSPEDIFDGEAPEEIIFGDQNFRRFAQPINTQEVIDASHGPLEQSIIDAANGEAVEGAQEEKKDIIGQLKLLGEALDLARREGYEEAQAELNSLAERLGETEKRGENLWEVMGQITGKYAQAEINSRMLSDEKEGLKAQMEAAHKIIEGYENTIEKYNAEIENLKNAVSAAKKDASESRRLAEERETSLKNAQNRITELSAAKDLIALEKLALEKAMNEIEAQFVEINDAKISFEGEYNLLQETSRQALEDVERKHKTEIDGYEKVIREERGKMAHFYGLILKASELEDGTKPKDLAAAIEKMSRERSELVKRVEDLEARLEDYRSSDGKQPSKPPKAPENSAIKPASEKTKLDALEGAARYVMLCMYITDKGSKEATFDKIREVVSSFEIIDPAVYRLNHEDIKILGEYFTIKCQSYSQSNFADTSMLVDKFLDDFVKPFLNDPILQEGTSRVMMKKNLEESYKKCTASRPK